MPESKPSPHEYVPLTPSQEGALSAFKESLTKAELWSSGDGKPSHDDVTLIRFLRARLFDPAQAQNQFAATEAWRKKHSVDQLYASFDPVEFEDSRKFYPRWTGRRDKNGRPVYVYVLAALARVQKDIDRVPPERRFQRIVALYEAMTRMILPMCSHLPHYPPGTPISSTTTIIDLKDVSLSSMWTWRNHLQEASKLATANYPETLNVIAVVNSPSFFPTIWGWIKGWFDEGTREKIYILGKDPGPTLRELIDANDLPKVYGGELEWNFNDPPNLDEDTKNLIGEMPFGPVVFSDGRVIRFSEEGGDTSKPEKEKEEAQSKQ